MMLTEGALNFLEVVSDSLQKNSTCIAFEANLLKVCFGGPELARRPFTDAPSRGIADLCVWACWHAIVDFGGFVRAAHLQNEAAPKSFLIPNKM